MNQSSCPDVNLRILCVGCAVMAGASASLPLLEGIWSSVIPPLPSFPCNACQGFTACRKCNSCWQRLKFHVVGRGVLGPITQNWYLALLVSEPRRQKSSLKEHFHPFLGQKCPYNSGLCIHQNSVRELVHEPILWAGSGLRESCLMYFQQSLFCWMRTKKLRRIHGLEWITKKELQPLNKPETATNPSTFLIWRLLLDFLVWWSAFFQINILAALCKLWSVSVIRNLVEWHYFHRELPDQTDFFLPFFVITMKTQPEHNLHLWHTKLDWKPA